MYYSLLHPVTVQSSSSAEQPPQTKLLYQPTRVLSFTCKTQVLMPVSWQNASQQGGFSTDDSNHRHSGGRPSSHFPKLSFLLRSKSPISPHNDTNTRPHTHTHSETDMHLGLSRMCEYKYTNKHTDTKHKQIL